MRYVFLVLLFAMSTIVSASPQVIANCSGLTGYTHRANEGIEKDGFRGATFVIVLDGKKLDLWYKHKGETKFTSSTNEGANVVALHANPAMGTVQILVSYPGEISATQELYQYDRKKKLLSIARIRTNALDESFHSSGLYIGKCL